MSSKIVAQQYDGMLIHEAMNHLQWIEEESGRLHKLVRAHKWIERGELATLWNNVHDLQALIEKAYDSHERQQFVASLSTQERAEYDLIQQNID